MCSTRADSTIENRSGGHVAVDLHPVMRAFMRGVGVGGVDEPMQGHDAVKGGHGSSAPEAVGGTHAGPEFLQIVGKRGVVALDLVDCRHDVPSADIPAGS